MTVVTAEEAAGKLCPELLPYIGAGEPSRECFCRGPACMVWRWLRENETRGYCGLGGTPDHAGTPRT